MQQEPRDTDFLIEQIQTLLHRESIYIVSSTATKNRRPPLQHIRFRNKILQWFTKVTDHFQYTREIVPTSMDFVDRFLLLYSSPEEISSRIYQLVAMTSLFLAMKLHSGEDKDIDFRGGLMRKSGLCLQEYAELSQGQFLPQEIVSMELCVLGTLRWRVNPVSPMCFVRYFLELMRPFDSDDDTIENKSIQDKDSGSQDMDLVMEIIRILACHFTELAISLPEITPYFHLDTLNIGSMDCRTFTPSTVAYASILLSMDAISRSALPSFVRESFLRRCMQFEAQEHLILHPDRKDIQELQDMIHKNFIPAVFVNLPSEDDNNIETFEIAIQQGVMHSTFLEGLSCSEELINDSNKPLSPTSTITELQSSSTTQIRNRHSSPHIPLASLPPRKRVRSSSSLSDGTSSSY